MQLKIYVNYGLNPYSGWRNFSLNRFMDKLGPSKKDPLVSFIYLFILRKSYRKKDPLVISYLYLKLILTCNEAILINLFLFTTSNILVPINRRSQRKLPLLCQK